MIRLLAVVPITIASLCFNLGYNEAKAGGGYGYHPSYYYYPSDYGYSYIYQDGYYWLGNEAYTRYYNPGYYSCGYYYAPYYSYVYHHTYYRPSYSTSYTNSNWRSQLLDIAKQRDYNEGELRRLTVEQASFLEGVQALGLSGNFNIQGFGQPLAYPGYGHNFLSPYRYNSSLNYGNYGLNGQTIYGYTYNSLKEAYGTTDMNVLYAQANKLAQNAQALGGQATTEFRDLVGAAGTNQSRVAEILARARAAEIALRATEPQPSVSVQTSEKEVTKEGEGGETEVNRSAVSRGPLNATPAEIYGAWKQSVELSGCLMCHSGGTKKGGFDVTLYPTFTREQRQKVLTRLVTDDETKRMPRTKDGHAGRRLTDEELAIWASVVGIQQQQPGPMQPRVNPKKQQQQRQPSTSY